MGLLRRFWRYLFPRATYVYLKTLKDVGDFRVCSMPAKDFDEWVNSEGHTVVVFDGKPVTFLRTGAYCIIIEREEDETE